MILYSWWVLEKVLSILTYTFFFGIALSNLPICWNGKCINIDILAELQWSWDYGLVYSGRVDNMGSKSCQHPYSMTESIHIYTRATCVNVQYLIQVWRPCIIFLKKFKVLKMEVIFLVHQQNSSKIVIKNFNNINYLKKYAHGTGIKSDGVKPVNGIPTCSILIVGSLIQI